MSEDTSAYLIRRLAETDRARVQRAKQLRAMADHLLCCADRVERELGAPGVAAVLITADGTDSAADVRVHSAGCDLAAAVGLLDIAKMELYTAGSEAPR